MLTTPECDCPRGFSPRGQLWWVHHRAVDCRGNQPRPAPPRRVRTVVDDLAELRRAFRGLSADLRDADNNIRAPSKRDWPPCDGVIVQELSIGGQLEHLYAYAARLVDQGCFAAKPLLKRTCALLEAAYSQSGFKAPAPLLTVPIRSLTPPPAIAAALERLRHVTPHTAALATPQPGDTHMTAQDRWLVRLWAAEIS